MLPTLRDGQIVLMKRYRTHAPRPGDVVVFRHQRDTCIKRIHATGGARIELARFEGGSTFLLDTLGPPGRMRAFFQRHPDLGQVLTVHVPSQSLFVVGDNHNLSDDSRDYGPIPASAVIGTVHAPSSFYPGLGSPLSRWGRYARRP